MGTVFITGASSGFGEACARKFAAQGRRLVISARRTQRIEKLAAELSKTTDILPLTMDVRDRKSVEDVIGNLQDEFRDIEVLVNNAGLALGLGPANSADLDEWDTMVDTNIKGLMYCTREILPLMLERKKGHVINIGSVAASWPYPGGNVYGGTKAFVQQFSRNLRADLLGKNIRVTNIEPGMSETEFSIVRFNGDEEQAGHVYDGTHPLSGDDIAEIVCWVVNSPSHININSLEVMPVCQAWSGFAVHRDTV